jgi:hypothetical protein
MRRPYRDAPSPGAVPDQLQLLFPTDKFASVRRCASHAEGGDAARSYVEDKQDDLFGGIKNWLSRRKDEADEAASRGKDEQRRMANSARNTADKVADKAR